LGEVSATDIRDYVRDNVARNTALLRAEIEALRTGMNITIRELRTENANLREALEEAEEAMRFVYTSCATFPREPQHIQNAAWRRIVNAVTKARAVLEQEERK